MSVVVFCPGANASGKGRQSAQGHIILSGKVTLRLENSTQLSTKCTDKDRIPQRLELGPLLVCTQTLKRINSYTYFKLFIEIQLTSWKRYRSLIQLGKFLHVSVNLCNHHSDQDIKMSHTWKILPSFSGNIPLPKGLPLF